MAVAGEVRVIHAEPSRCSVRGRLQTRPVGERPRTASPASAPPTTAVASTATTLVIEPLRTASAAVSILEPLRTAPATYLHGPNSQSRAVPIRIRVRGTVAVGPGPGESTAGITPPATPVKTKAGGQSAQRFARERERQKEAFFESVAEEAERAFLGDHDAESDSANAEIDGLLLGGTTVTVDDFREGDHLDHRLEDRLVGDPVSVEYASEQGLQQLVEKASDRIEDEERREMREALDRFFEALHSSGSGKSSDNEVVYGEEAVDDALTYDAADTVLVSASLPIDKVREFEDRATNEGGDYVVVPTDFDRGRQFHDAFGGVAARLRLPIE